jgi:hypothetical protein
MNKKEWITIPVLPCVSIDETLLFWETLGFKITFYQKSPYQYAVIKRGEYELHFRRVKGLEPANSNSFSLIMVSNAELVHRNFAQKLKTATGKFPASGLPRVSRMKPQQTRFTVTDPSGNSVIFISLGEEDSIAYDQANQPGLTPLQKSIATAIRLRDFKNDYIAALKTINTGLNRSGKETPDHIAQAIQIKAELQIEMKDFPL